MTDQEIFVGSRKAASRYPENVVRHNTTTHNLKAYREILDERAKLLFCVEGKADLDVWEYYDAQPDFCSRSVSSTFELKTQFEGEHLFDNKDPRCRYLFIHARHSRDRLRISLDMFLYALTYHQVTPEFLEFVFPFGWQEYQDDFHFSGFREEARLLAAERGLNIPELGRSGQDFRLCYALKSVEKSTQESWPWSIRQTATYHSFEVDTGKMFWIFVKGNELMRNRIQEATESARLKKHQIKSVAESFAVSLETHLIVCEWAADNWRWYINFLQRRLEDMTRPSLAIRITRAPSMLAPQDAQEPQPSNAKRRRTVSWKTIKHMAPPTSKIEPTSFIGAEMRPLQVQLSSPPPPPGGQPPPPPPPPPSPLMADNQKLTQVAGQVPSGEPEFSLHDLQELQSLEDKVNEINQVLIANTKILEQLKAFYESLIDLQGFPDGIKQNCQRGIAKFSKHITNFISNLQMHKSRTETLLRLLADRKTLLYSILDYRSIEANRLLAKRTQESAERMEEMTREMNRIAIKTKDETVSMKIITLVTLFYLPGTFISTVMSTDIVRFPSPNGGFQWPALAVWLEATLPLMFVTFVAWGVVYRGVERGWFAQKS